jgi:hypothetical protein
MNGQSRFEQSQVGEALEAIKDGLGWTLDEVDEIYRSISKGTDDFPPVQFRPANFADLLHKRKELVRPANRKLFKLMTLIQREQGNYAFFSSLLDLPQTNYNEILSQLRMESGMAIGNITDPLAHAMRRYINQIFSNKQGGGNEYASRRTALQVLLAADVCFRILAHVPHFAPVLQDVNSIYAARKARKEEEQAQQTVNGAKNEQTPEDEKKVEAEDKSKFLEGAEEYKRPAHVSVVPKLRAYSRHLGENNHTVVVNENSKKPGEIVHVVDFVKEALTALEEQRKQEIGLQFLPLSDLLYTIVAMYFDGPLELMRKKQQNESTAMELTAPAYLPMLVFFAPLFIHSDANYLREWQETNPREPISLTFLAPLFGKKEPDGAPAVLAMSNAAKIMLRGGTEKFSVLDGIAKDLLNVRNAPSHAGKPHQWADASAEPFRDISENLLQVATVLHSRQPTAPIERAQLMSWLINMASPPDVLSKLTNLADISEYEKKAIDFSMERFLSTSAFLSNLNLLKNQTSMSYPYVQAGMIPVHTQEFYERFVSRLSGYRYPYTATERPDAEDYKNPIRIIEFLFFNLKKLQYGVKNQKNNPQSLDDEDAKYEMCISGEQYDLRFSEFLQKVIHQLQQDPDTMKGKIKDWYDLSQRYYSDTSVARELNLSVTKFLGKLKYDDNAAKVILQLELQNLQKDILGWIECQEFLVAYKKFLHKHREDLIAGMLEHIDANSGSSSNKEPDITTQIPLFYVPSSVLDSKRNDLIGQTTKGKNDVLLNDDIYHNIRLSQL